ncbi:MAG: sulfite exporter TauE/SafE family protein [Bacteriovoracaceae bacterium]|nr:sulfite exporter TauE/SafE family protein [Bacteriovoracaceae bacterium]
MSLTLTQLFIIIPIAMGLSCIGTLVGVGGGIFMVPLLVLGFGIPLKMAIAAVTVCMFPAALLSTIYNHKGKQIDYFVGIVFEIPTILGTVIGAYLTTIVPVKPLEVMFSVLVLFMGYKIMRKKKDLTKMNLLHHFNQVPPLFHRTGEHPYQFGLPAIGVLGTLAGVLAGMFGIGGGIIKTPVMLKIFKMPPRKATSTALFMIVFTSATASYSHWSHGRLDWNLATPLIAAFFLGSVIGNQFTSKIKPKALEKTLGYVLMASSVAILTHALFI